MSEFQSGVKFRAHPDPALENTLRQWIGCQRFIYYSKVEEDRLFAAQRRMLLRDKPDAVVSTPLDQQYSHFKDRGLTPWLYEVPSQILRNGAVRWMGAKQRQLKKLAKAPARRSRLDFNSVLVTSELFRFVNEEGQTVIELGTHRHPIGRLPFKAHRPYALPKQIILREVASQWFVSFSYVQGSADILRTPAEPAYELDLLDDATLASVTLGIDRNVKDNCLAVSDGRQFHLDAINLERIQRKEAGARRYQRSFAVNANFGTFARR